MAEEERLTSERVRHIAMLARVGITDEDVETLRGQLSSILAHMEQLNELETETIPPTAQVIALHDVMEADEPRESYPAGEMLANAPDREGDYFRVKTVLGYET